MAPQPELEVIEPDERSEGSSCNPDSISDAATNLYIDSDTHRSDVGGDDNSLASIETRACMSDHAPEIIGRDREIAELRRLAREDSNIQVLFGAVGVGKRSILTQAFLESDEFRCVWLDGGRHSFTTMTAIALALKHSLPVPEDLRCRIDSLDQELHSVEEGPSRTPPTFFGCCTCPLGRGGQKAANALYDAMRDLLKLITTTAEMQRERKLVLVVPEFHSLSQLYARRRPPLRRSLLRSLFRQCAEWTARGLVAVFCSSWKCCMLPDLYEERIVSHGTVRVSHLYELDKSVARQLFLSLHGESHSGHFGEIYCDVGGNARLLRAFATADTSSRQLIAECDRLATHMTKFEAAYADKVSNSWCDFSLSPSRMSFSAVIACMGDLLAAKSRRFAECLSLAPMDGQQPMAIWKELGRGERDRDAALYYLAIRGVLHVVVTSESSNLRDEYVTFGTKYRQRQVEQLVYTASLAKELEEGGLEVEVYGVPSLDA